MYAALGFVFEDGPGIRVLLFVSVLGTRLD